MRIARSAAAAVLAALACVGAADPDRPAAGRAEDPAWRLKFVGGMEVVKSIEMFWRGRCPVPGDSFQLQIVTPDGENITAVPSARCGDDGTFRVGSVVRDYADKGLDIGKKFDYRAYLISEEVTVIEGSDTLDRCDTRCLLQIPY